MSLYSCDSNRKATICHSVYSVCHSQMVANLPEIDKKSCICVPEPHIKCLWVSLVWLRCIGCQAQHINLDTNKQAMTWWNHHFISASGWVQRKKKKRQKLNSRNSHLIFNPKIVFFFQVSTGKKNCWFDTNVITLMKWGQHYHSPAFFPHFCLQHSPANAALIPEREAMSFSGSSGVTQSYKHINMIQHF